MASQLHELFVASCGLFGKWRLRISGPKPVVAERDFLSPYVFAGNREEGGLHLPDPEVSRRHAYLQVLPGGVYCIDLGSRTGLHWGDADRDAGWLCPGQGVRIGPYVVDLLPPHLDGWLSPGGRPHHDPLTYPMDAPARGHVPLAPFVVEVTNAGGVTTKGKMNRALALLGRSPRCLFHIDSPSVSKIHCSFVRTPAGLWVVDLHSREGTFLNGRQINLARVHEGDLVRVGNYALRFQRLRPKAAVSVALPKTESSRATAALQPPSEGSKALGSSFGSTAVEPFRSGEAGASTVAARAKQTKLAALDERLAPEWSVLVALVNQFNLMQVQMFDQFQESILKTSRLFANLHQDQMALVRKELDELRGITGELRTLQVQATGRAVPSQPALNGGQVGLNPDAAGAAAGEAAPPDGVRGDPGPMGRGKFPNGRVAPGAAALQSIPSGVRRSGPPPEDGLSAPTKQPPGPPEEVHVWLNQRIADLQQERQSRWDKLLGVLVGN